MIYTARSKTSRFMEEYSINDVVVFQGRLNTIGFSDSGVKDPIDQQVAVFDMTHGAGSKRIESE